MADSLIVTATLNEAFNQVGLTCPDEASPGMHRFSTNGKGQDRAGWLRIFDDGDGAVFGCWRESATFTWQRRKDGPPPSKADLSAFRAKAEQAKKQAHAEREQAYQQAAAAAAKAWQIAEPAAAHEYLFKKLIKPHGTRTQGESLLIPVLDGDGNIQSLQTIRRDGTKKFMHGGRVSGGRYLISDQNHDPERGPLVITEGFATGATINESTGFPVVVAFNAGNLTQVACSIREQFPHAKLVIAGDDDRHTKGNPGRTQALTAATAAQAIAVFPELGEHGSDFNDMAMQSDLASVGVLIRNALQVERFRLLTRDDLNAMKPIQWLVKGVLPRHGLAALYGPSASGKSFLAFDMAAAIAAGQEWFGYRVSSAPVVYMGLEGEAGFRNRARAWEAHNKRQLPDGLSLLLQAFRLNDDVLELTRVIPAGAVIVIDTLNRAAPLSDENSSRDMGEILDAAKQLQALTGGLVLMVHHTGKDATKGLRGHSSLFAALDAAIEVSRVGEARSWRVAKAKDGQDGQTHPFKLDVVTLEYDDDGDAVTSCAVEVDQNANAVRQVKLPQGGNQRLVLDALRALLKNAERNPSGAPPDLLAGKSAIELEVALPKLAASLTCANDKKTSRARDSITGLVTRGVVAFKGGWLWIN